MTVQKFVSDYRKGKAMQANAIAELTKLLKRKAWDSVRAELMPCVSKAWDVPMVEGSGKAKGTMVLDSDAENYENAKRALFDMVTAIKGKKNSGNTEEDAPKFTQAQLKSAKAYLALFESRAQAITALKQL